MQGDESMLKAMHRWWSSRLQGPCLNCSELIELKCSNVTFKADNIVINVQPTRTDQYQEGPVHHAGGQLYALACKMMETYTCTFMWES